MKRTTNDDYCESIPSTPTGSNFLFNSGVIEECESESGAGALFLWFYAHATLEESAVIKNCHTGDSGGGVFLSISDTSINLNGGSIMNNEAVNSGGGIATIGGKIIFNSGTLFNNKAKKGGGISAVEWIYSTPKYTGQIIINDGEIFNNSASEFGGAFYIIGMLEIKGGNIFNCSAECGGMTYIDSPSYPDEQGATMCKISGGKIENCVANSDGGAIQINDGNVYITGGKILNNLAKGENSNTGYGGGIFVNGGEIVRITGGEISNNIAAKNGGGIEVKTDKIVTVEIYSGTFENNVAESSGGAVGIDCPNGTINVGKMNCDGSASSEHIHPILKNNVAGLHGGGFYMSGAEAVLNIYCASIDNNKIGDVENNFEQVSGTITVYENVKIGSDKEGIIVIGGTFYDKSQKDATQFVITYHCNFGENTEFKSASVTNGASITLPGNIFGVEGYEVLGWTTNPADTNTIEYNVGQIINGIQSITIYALWIEESANEPTYIVMIPSGIELDSNNQSATFEINATLTLFPRTKALVVNLVDADMKLELLADNNQIVSEILYTLSQSESETYSNSNTILEVYSETALIEHKASKEFTIELEDDEPIYSGVYLDNLTFECEMIDV